MYSSQTYDVVKNRTLSNIDLNIYKGEGSFLSDMVSPVNSELAKFYIELSYLHKKAFIEDNFDDFLDKRVNEFGVYRKLGTEATGEVTFEGKVGTVIPNGTIISYNELLFVVIKDIVISSKIEQNTSPVQALEIGIRYNIPASTEFKQDEINGITKIYNDVAFRGGTEIETDEELKERFYKIQKNQATSGNKAHYEEWALEVEGVYNAKIYPRWDGAGTVKVLIFGVNNQAVDSEVIERCREHIETEMPIGATLTVATPSILDISISATIKLEIGYTIDFVKESFLESINSYLINVNKEIIYTKVSAILASIEGIHDFSNLLLNNKAENIVFEEDKVPSVTNLEFSEVVVQ
ncbi:TPA: baseplate J/gp47 family protein [Clostridioides difficile]|uniref:baseplate J/gp47 family protein n=1 Tax=Clostridioides difficile TaxID=1496 RepID=UPI001C1D23C4|nr:baseplate J/gp47 family protein [Clostridioides difficile]MBY1606050.1 baseplate J/gp47 family protein [Clostridioides difficile]MCI4781334.1 baseplate J/gp47 family protein [Clostridioides difficile]MCO5840043.1 baseplate J/gp47 family protein [Clostridioides difficile]MCZ1128806.1 baseplate J/gp47 family protein [Clostridioides difficile]MDC9476450.1 baseplate J/gp47 family protein [Clostridioides difficile]